MAEGLRESQATFAKALSFGAQPRCSHVRPDTAELADDVLGRVEQDATVRLAEHRRVVVGIAGPRRS